MMSIARRLTAAAMTLCMLLTLFPMGFVTAEALVTTDGYQYLIKTDGTAKITGYTGVDTTLVLPTAVGGCTVSEIAPFAFRNRTTLQEITIPDTVTVLGDAAFANCTALELVCLPDGITELRFLTFCDCTALKELVLPASLSLIDATAFKHCNALRTIYYDGDDASRAAIEIDGTATALSQATWYYGPCGQHGRHHLLYRGHRRRVCAVRAQRTRDHRCGRSRICRPSHPENPHAVPRHHRRRQPCLYGMQGA